MLSIIKNLLLKVIENIDNGNCNITEEEGTRIITYLKDLNTSNRRMSKYLACQYLNISRATFDNYIREGKLPKGQKVAGFKELSWSKKDLDAFIKKG